MGESERESGAPSEAGDGRQAIGESERESERGAPAEGSLLVVRVGHGANCSSIGSVIDTLFIGATVGGAILAAVFAAMKDEGVSVVGGGAAARDEREGEREGGGA